jgi:hypothetical protein
MKSNLFIAICITAILLGRLFEENFFPSLIEPNLLNWLVLIAFVGSWVKFIVEFKSSNSKAQ